MRNPVLKLLATISIIILAIFLEIDTAQIERILGATDTFFVEEATESTQKTEQEAVLTASNSAVVSRVIDGDTVELSTGQIVRYIGIDSPETKKPNNPVECFGQEATQKNRELVKGREVTLIQDVNNTDRYGRLLRYVYVDGVMINEQLVQEGYAVASSYPPDVKYQDLLHEAEEFARENKLGLWGDACKPTTTTLVTPPPTPIVTTAPVQAVNLKTASPTKQPATSAPVINDSGGCKYSCTGPDRDCSDFSSHSEAQAFFNCCGFTAENDPMGLDGRGVDDGIACESI